MSQKNPPRTGKITCAKCGSHVVAGTEVPRVFCSNRECKESEFFWILEEAIQNA
jgi:endogenous inhibitor of DNA gyrase (YacG/DUF329 family)